MAAASAEETILRREVNKKRLKPLRKLFGEIPEKVARYSPASVLVVKQYEGRVRSIFKRVFG